MSIVAAALLAFALTPAANPTPHPSKLVAANPTPHPGKLVAANPTPHPYPVPVIDIVAVDDRLVVKLRTPDGKNRTLLTSVSKMTGISYPTLAFGAKGSAKTAPLANSVEGGTPLLSIGCDGVASDGKSRWDFKTSSTFMLPDGTKIVMRTQPGKPNRECGSVDVMSGKNRVHVSTSKRGAIRIGAVQQDRWTVDAKTKSSAVYIAGVFPGRGQSKLGWVQLSRTKGEYRANRLIAPPATTGGTDAEATDAAETRTPGGVRNRSRQVSLKLTNVIISSLTAKPGGRKGAPLVVTGRVNVQSSDSKED